MVLHAYFFGVPYTHGVDMIFAPQGLHYAHRHLDILAYVYIYIHLMNLISNIYVYIYSSKSEIFRRLG